MLWITHHVGRSVFTELLYHFPEIRMTSTRTFLFGLLLAGFCSCFAAEVLVPLKADWRYLKGTAEASNPTTAWRDISFDDSSWPSGKAPIYYGENIGPGVLLSDMRSNYTTVFLRTRFVLTNALEIDRLALRTLVDDGFIAWINGTEVARFNVTGDKLYNGVADATIEMTWVTNSFAAPASLVNG